VKDLRGKRCFITGAASGIGRATAIATAAKGADIYLTDVQAEILEGVVAEIRNSGGTVSYSKAADVTDREAIVAMAAEIHAAHGSMEIFGRALRHAASLEQVAGKILTGIERDRYMVHTSSDTRILFWLQRKFAPLYELAMRVANKRFDALAERD
jgi:NAD(P)-dependent dehydrogenase (short-subunit alcohol dehydrogenase family)